MNSYAQNLVPNPSFEEYSSCPTGNELGDGQFMKCTGWWYPHSSSLGTPDYFNACNTGIVGVPNNFQGYQEALHGDGYIGLGAFECWANTLSMFAKEFVQTKLVRKLKPCYRYKIVLNVSLANKSTHGIASLGILLGTEAAFFENLNPIEATWESSYSLSDTAQWITIEGIIEANGGEEYLTIGYFGDYDANQLTLNDSAQIVNFQTFFPYYYIDSISLFEVEEIIDCAPEIPNVFTPNGDGVNDVFSFAGLKLEEIIILNRWGNVITTLNHENTTWNGEGYSEGTYFYVGNFNGNKITGFIELIR